MGERNIFTSATVVHIKFDSDYGVLSSTLSCDTTYPNSFLPWNWTNFLLQAIHVFLKPAALHFLKLSIWHWNFSLDIWHFAVRRKKLKTQCFVFPQGWAEEKNCLAVLQISCFRLTSPSALRTVPNGPFGGLFLEQSRSNVPRMVRNGPNGPFAP